MDPCEQDLCSVSQVCFRVFGHQDGRFMGCCVAKKTQKTLVSVFFLLMHEHFDFTVFTRDFSV